MDRPTLVCGAHEMEHNISENKNYKSQRPPLLRRVSQSEPHLDIPQFINNSEKSFNNSLHHILSGIFDNNHSGKRFEVNSDSLLNTLVIPSQMSKSIKDTNLSGSIGLSSSSSKLIEHKKEESSPLRKVSSSLSHLSTERSQPTSTLAQLSSHFWGSTNQGSIHNISTIPEDQGIMMSVRSSTSSNAFNSSLVSNNDTKTFDSTNISAASAPPLTGVMSVFGRGFFAKPVMCNEEENYRYIMALDR